MMHSGKLKRHFSHCRVGRLLQHQLIAYRILMRSPDTTLIAVHEGKYYKRPDGLAIGPGCFTRGLEYSTGKKAIVIGKPNPYFFRSAIPDSVRPEECCMIGDVSNLIIKQNVMVILIGRKSINRISMMTYVVLKTLA